MEARYYKTPKHVMFYNPIQRLLAKVFGPESCVMRCKTCNKIPTEMYGDYCFNHKDISI